jgi:KUP system potassium uptake protein
MPPGDTSVSATRTRDDEPLLPRASRAHPPSERAKLSPTAKLALGALGVVYGDIGTSPIYAIKECFVAEHHLAVERENVLGVISLVFWSIAWVIVFKYLTFVMRVDNRGEGGIFALLALVTQRRSRWVAFLVPIGLAGAALLYGDAVITPAISVLSAVEGLSFATRVFDPWVVPITLAILVLLFVVQKRGTGSLGAILGPLTLVWFITIAAIGLPWILREPDVLHAVDPRHAIRFLGGGHGSAYLILGSVVLCITGGEALYADMGHFGRKPIRWAWYAVVYPALLVSYFGQGALLLSEGRSAANHPFFAQVDGLFVYPVVGIATIATIIASQALISGAYSLTQQAAQLGYLPRVNVIHTSGEHEGQIYIPEVNWILMVGCLALVLGFRESSALAAAYGIAVTGTMGVTSVLFFEVVRRRWGIAPALVLLVLFLVVDLAFFGANLVKIATGGWVPILIGAAIFGMMTTWKRGRAELARFVKEKTLPIEPFLEELAQGRLGSYRTAGDEDAVQRIDGAAVFMTANAEGVPPSLRHHLEHNRVLHEKVVLLTIVTEHVPEVSRGARVRVRALGQGFSHVVAHYGFLERPRIAAIFDACRDSGLDLEIETTSFYLGRETLLLGGKTKMARFRKWIFRLMSRNASSAAHYFDIPPDRVMEIGMQVEL